MQILSIQQEDMTLHGKTTTCIVHTVIVKIKDVESYAKEMIDLISDQNWIKKLGVVEQASYDARAKRTIEKLVTDIFKKVDDAITTDFGEYMISCSAQEALHKQLAHIKVPLAELWKEKVTGNPGFDFHTETTNNLIAFGEAKYSGSINPYTNALTQIVEFIGLEKDVSELSDLKNFVTETAINRHLKDKHRAFIAAFSVNSTTPQEILKNVLTSDNIDNLLTYPELYLIGIQV